jgi:hypothetical protein
MGVFLRWGIFGILGVAALIYAYNASKELAESRARKPPAAAQVEPAGDRPPAVEAEPAADGPSAQCAAELAAARRALQSRRDGEPLDRLLRYPEIAWQEPPARRERLTQVATYWFNLEGDAPIPAEFRSRVLADCEKFNPAP